MENHWNNAKKRAHYTLRTGCVYQSMGRQVTLLTKVATHLAAGTPLELFATTFTRKLVKGTVVIPLPNGNKARDWAIRSLPPKFVSDKNMAGLQRLNGCGKSMKD